MIWQYGLSMLIIMLFTSNRPQECHTFIIKSFKHMIFIWGYLMAFWHRRKIQIIIKSWDFESHIIKSEGIIKKKLVFKHSKKWTSRTLWTFPWEKNPGKLPKRPRNAEHSGLRGGGSGTRGEDLRRLAGGGEEGGDGQPWPAIGGGFTQKPWVFQGN